MWKCVALLLFLGQWIIVTSELAASEDQIARHARNTDNCCPCPETSRSTDNDPSASETFHVIDDCPCKSRSADSDTAASIFSPALSAIHPFTRHAEQKAEPKPLLEPEVDLASSVLQTLREATEEEYQEALARDAARSVNHDESLNNLVDIVNPEAREDDVLSEASTNYNTRCIHPFLEDNSNVDLLGRNSIYYPNKIMIPQREYRPDLQRSHYDMNEAASNIHAGLSLPNRNVIFPNGLTFRKPLQNLLQRIPYSHDRGLSIAPSGHLDRFLLENEENILPVKSALPLAENSWRQLDLNNLLNSRDVEFIPLKKVTIHRENKIKPEEIVQPIDNSHVDSDGAFSENHKLDNFNKKKDCIAEGNTKTNLNNMSVETKILNTIPNQRESNTDGIFNEPENNLIQNDKTESSENSRDFSKEMRYDSGEKLSSHDTNNINDRAIMRDNDGAVEESRDNFNIISAQDPRNHQNNEKFSSNGLSDVREHLSIPANNNYKRFQEHDNNLPLIKNNILQTLEDFKQANTIIHDNLKSSLDNVLQLDDKAREVSSNDCDKSVLPKASTPIQSKNLEDNGLSIKDLQHMSNRMLLNNDGDNKVSLKSSEPNSFSYNKLIDQNDAIIKLPSEQIINEMTMNNPKTAQTDRSYTNNEDIHSENFDTCMINDEHKNENSNIPSNHIEMKMAASEPTDTRSRIFRIPQIKDLKPLEDINLELFDYQPPSFGQGNARNSYSSLPRLNMKSYKTQLPIPKSLDLKPVKLQKAVRKGNDILGAILTINPHTEKLNNKMRSSQSRNDHNIFGHSLEILPSIDDIKSFLENNAKKILKLPQLSKKVSSKYAAPLPLNIDDATDNLRTYTEDTLKNVQKSLGNTFKNIHGSNRILEDVFVYPNSLVESVSRNHEDVNDKLNDFKSNLNDRLENFRQNVFEQSRSPSYFIPQYDAGLYNLNPKNVNTKTNNKLVGSKSVGLDVSENRQSPLSRLTPDRGSDNFKSKGNLKPTIPPLRSVNSRTSIKPPTIKTVKTNNVLENMRASQLNSKRPLTLHEILKLPKESKSITSFTTTKKPPALLANKKPSLFERKINKPTPFLSTLPERGHITRNQLNKEQKTSPSEIIYRNTPVSGTSKSTGDITQNEKTQKNPDIRQLSRLPTSQSFLKKSILPNIAENNFLSKMKEAVTPKDINSRFLNRNSNNEITDVIPSALNSVKSEPLQENVSYNCKMVCGKN